MSPAPDPIIVSARLAVLVPSPTALQQKAWNGLQAALEAYDAAMVSSLSSEGVSRSMDVSAAAKQVAEWFAAYQQATSENPPGTDPVLTAQPLGHTVSHYFVPLRF